MNFFQKLFGRDFEREADKLAVAVNGIYQLEKRKGKAEKALKESEDALADAVQVEIREGNEEDHADLVAAITEQEVRLKSLNAMLEEGKEEVEKLIAANRPVYRERLGSVEEQIVAMREERDRKRFQQIASFAHRHDFQINLPTEHNTGQIIFPASCLRRKEMQEILALAGKEEKNPDGLDRELLKLADEKLRLSTMIQQIPKNVVGILLDKARREASQ